MTEEPTVAPPPAASEGDHWSALHGKSILFVILTLIAAGIYLAFTIPVSVFPSTNFPRILIAVDNGVSPIDQMLVTVTKPIEEAVNTVQGLQRVTSVTSRGSAEVDLYFTWNIDMFLTLQRVNSAISGVQPLLPPTVITFSPGCSPLTTCNLSGSLTPVSIFLSCATESAPTTITILPPCCEGSRAAGGITTASRMVSASTDICTVTPDLSFSPGLAASTQTSTVVLLGSTAGLTTLTVP